MIEFREELDRSRDLGWKWRLFRPRKVVRTVLLRERRKSTVVDSEWRSGCKG